MIGKAPLPIRYQWRDGFFSRIDPAVAGQAMEAIERQHGRLDPDVLLAASQQPDSPLHGHFEWDDARAAGAYRRDQAAELIRSLVVVAVSSETEEELPPVRAFVRITMAPPAREENQVRYYTPITRVMNDEELRQSYLRQALADLATWRKRYSNISEFASLFDAIDAVAQLSLQLQ